jgi:hypothetical protein
MLFAFAVLVGVVFGGLVLFFHETRVNASCTIGNITWTNNTCQFMGDDSCPKPQDVSCKVEAPMLFFGQIAK